ncbi:MAG: hypothetical protein A2X64_05185 [Ignavibacteria bacterium GWF2_33_9]|nr:MAG: hypothetical protein A2X64_05185 [Ignavibacteria bacterium GWF2_33_9]
MNKIIIDNIDLNTEESDEAIEMLQKASLELQENDEELWFHEWNNAVDSLNTATFLLKKESHKKWKWITICIHHAFYSICIAVQTNGNFRNVLNYNNNNKPYFSSTNGIDWIKSEKIDLSEYFYKIKWNEIIYSVELEKLRIKFNEVSAENDNEVSTETVNVDFNDKNLIGFQTVLARVMDPKVFMNRYEGQKALELTNDEMQNIIRIHLIRNEYVHFKPQLNVYNINQIKHDLQTYLKCIYFLVFESHSLIHLNHEEKILLKDNIEILEKAINA